MTRSPRLVLPFALLFALMIMAPAFLSQQFALYELIKVGDVLDIFTPLTTATGSLMVSVSWPNTYKGASKIAVMVIAVRANWPSVRFIKLISFWDSNYPFKRTKRTPRALTINNVTPDQV